jgi:hypothetical protein
MLMMKEIRTVNVAFLAMAFSYTQPIR